MFGKKETNFFELVAQAGVLCCDIAKELLDLVKDFKEVPVKAERIRRYKVKSTKQLDEMHLKLTEAFITPIDREDFLSIAKLIDDTIDNIKEVADRIDIFEVGTLRPETLKFAEYIYDCSKDIMYITAEFYNFRKSKTLTDKIKEISTFERKCDDFYRNVIRTLFINEKDPRELIIWQRIFEYMERCVDACDDIGHEMRTVILKNS
ncbi:MAG: DUF47 family protein [Clostridiales bacterium]|jgi:predicted phosphate transport protein (TIGR00153 family)|nr:DUF47 family protein [Clostridiales bacterium]